MQWIVSHKPEFCLIVIYIGYWSIVDSLQQNVKSTSKLNSEEVSTPMGLNGPSSKLIYHDDTIYEGQISYWFTLVHKGILVITQGCTKDS